MVKVEVEGYQDRLPDLPPSPLAGGRSGGGVGGGVDVAVGGGFFLLLSAVSTILPKYSGILHAADVLHDLEHRGQGLGHVLEEAGGGPVAVVAAVLPDDDLVELDVRDRLRRRSSRGLDVFEHQELEGLLGAAAGGDDLAEPFGLLGEDLVVAAGLGLELGEDGLGVALGLDPRASRRAASASTITWAFLALATASSWARCSASIFSAWASAALAWARKAASSTPAWASRLLGLADLEGLGLLDGEVGVRGGDLRLGFVLAADRLGVGLGQLDAHLALGQLDAGLLFEGRRLHADLLFLQQFGDPDGPLALGRLDPDLAELLGVGDLDRLELLGLGDADRAVFLLLGDVDLGLVDRGAGGLPADRLDVARVVGQVGDVDVDQHQADLPEFHLQRVLDVLQELLAVAVDIVDRHRGDHLAELAEDQVRRLGADLLAGQVQAGGSRRSASPRARCRWRR